MQKQTLPLNYHCNFSVHANFENTRRCQSKIQENPAVAYVQKEIDTALY